MKKSAEEQQLLDQVKSLTPEQAQEKVAALKRNPQDDRTYYELMRYYELHSDLSGKDSLILWYIEHAPGGKVRPWNINPGWDRAGYERGKRLWVAKTKKPHASADIYERAADFLQGADKSLAEEILLSGRKAYPGDPRWGRSLGEQYAMALLGSGEAKTEYNVIRTFSVSEAHGAYAQSVRAELEQSTDSRLLAQTAQYLTVWGRGPAPGLSSDTLALAESYASRAVALDPSNDAAHIIKLQTTAIAEGERLRNLRKLSAQQQHQLPIADRILLASSEMDQAWSPSGRKPDFALAATKARELLNLAQRNPSAPHSGYAVFEANIMLGKVALRKGDKRKAAQYLLASAEAPASDELRYRPMLMNLPRALIDWGERDVTAQFLERIAPKMLRTKDFQDWALQVRKGVNPDMRPVMIGCGQEPC